MSTRVLTAWTLALLMAFTTVGSNKASATLLQNVGQPKTRLVFTTLMALRYNPLGIGMFNTLHLRRRLYEHKHAALRDNYLGVGGLLVVNPVRLRAGVLGEFSPLTPLRFWILGEAVAWQPLLGVRSDPTMSGEWNEDLIQELLTNNNTSYGATGFYVTAGMDAQIKIGPVAARAFLKAVRSAASLKDNDQVFYDANLDASLPNNGVTLTGDFDLLGVVGPVAFGLRGTLTHPIYDDVHFGRKASLSERLWNVNGPMARVGPLVAWTMYSKDGALFNKPTIAFILQWHLRHRYRSGQQDHVFISRPLAVPAPFSIGVPYIAVAFTGFGDLLDVPTG